MNNIQKLLIIVGFGPVAGYKYSRCIRKAIDSKHIIGYAVVDLISQKDNVLGRIEKLPIKPLESRFLEDTCFQNDNNLYIKEFHEFCELMKLKYNHELKVVIATEPQAHEYYLQYCIEKQIDALVTKPITLPIKNKILDHTNIYQSFKNLIDKIPTGRRENYAAICLTRHHEIYNEGVINNILNKIKLLNTPITSIRLNTNSGIWNLNNEFKDRDDHPYKYGYGMLFHGGYHYIDLIAQTLLLNKLVFPEQSFYIELSSYSAFPIHQYNRISKNIIKKLTNYTPKEEYDLQYGTFGETDIISSFSVKLKNTNEVIALGTLSLEQTTPGMRSWFNFPEVPYNINGRLHCTDFVAQLATLYSVKGSVLKIPIGARKSETDLRGKNLGTITTRSNAIMTGDQEFFTEKNIYRQYGDSFSYTAEMEIFMRWVTNQPTHSNLRSHIASVAWLEALAISSKKDGEKIVFDYDFELPEYIYLIENNETTYNDSKDIIFSAYQRK